MGEKYKWPKVVRNKSVTGILYVERTEAGAKEKMGSAYQDLDLIPLAFTLYLGIHSQVTHQVRDKEKMMEIEGVKTIMPLRDNPPKEITVSFNMIRTGESLRRLWNQHYIAFIPYCYVCAEPLVWHSPPEPDGTLFHCPKCKRRWIMDDKWVEAVLRKERIDEE